MRECPLLLQVKFGNFSLKSNIAFLVFVAHGTLKEPTPYLQEIADAGILPTFAYEDRMKFFLELKEYLKECNRNYVVLGSTNSDGSPNYWGRSQDARIELQNMFDKLKKA